MQSKVPSRSQFRADTGRDGIAVVEVLADTRCRFLLGDAVTTKFTVVLRHGAGLAHAQHHLGRRLHLRGISTKGITNNKCARMFCHADAGTTQNIKPNRATHQNTQTCNETQGGTIVPNALISIAMPSFLYSPPTLFLPPGVNGDGHGGTGGPNLRPDPPPPRVS